MMLIMRKTLSVIFALKIDITVEMPKNHITEAEAKPPTKKASVPAGSVVLKAPSIMEPSINACGLNQVTTHAEVITFRIGRSTFVEVSMFDLERISPIPIQVTMILPIRRIAISVA